MKALTYLEVLTSKRLVFGWFDFRTDKNIYMIVVSLIIVVILGLGT